MSLHRTLRDHDGLCVCAASLVVLFEGIVADQRVSDCRKRVFPRTNIINNLSAGTYVSAQLSTHSLVERAAWARASAYTTRSVCAAPLPRKDRGGATVRQRGLLSAAPPAPAWPREVASRLKCTTASGPSLLLVRAQALPGPTAARVSMVSVCSLQPE